MDKSKLLWGVVLVMIGLITIQTKAYGESWNWELFLKDVDCDFYYDPDTVAKLPENIVKVWWKEVFKTRQVLKSRGFKQSEYEKADYQVNVTEINCKKKMPQEVFYALFGRRRNYSLYDPRETIGGMGSCEGGPCDWSPLLEAMSIISHSFK